MENFVKIWTVKYETKVIKNIILYKTLIKDLNVNKALKKFEPWGFMNFNASIFLVQILGKIETINEN